MNLKYQLQYEIKGLNYLMDSYSVSDIQDYFKYILKNMRQLCITLNNNINKLSRT